jgi:hypothetical protein
MFTFISFDVEENYDYLYIFNGTSTSAPQIDGSPYTGTTLPGNFMATNEDGAITFRFVADNYVPAEGWAAEFSCVDLSVSPSCSSNPIPAVGEKVIATPVKLKWDFVAGALQYDVYFGKDELPEEPVATVSKNYYSAEIEANSNYVWKIVPKNEAGQAEGCDTWEFYTEELADVVNMSNGVITTCNTILYDSGGSENFYQNGENLKLTINPVDSWTKVIISFTEFRIEEDWDFLKIYNGNTTTSANLIGTYTGSTLPPIISSTHSSGALTLHFTSDDYVNDMGWAATISCETKWQPVTFEIKNGSGSPIEGVKITTPLSELFTNSQGTVSEDFPQNCNILYEISKEGFSLQEGNFFVGEEPKTVSLVMYPVSSDFTESENSSIFPNPFSNTLTLNYVEKFKRYSIVTATGQTLISESINGNQSLSINTQRLSKGIYMLVLTGKDGELVVKKLVKE